MYNLVTILMIVGVLVAAAYPWMLFAKWVDVDWLMWLLGVVLGNVIAQIIMHLRPFRFKGSE